MKVIRVNFVQVFRKVRIRHLRSCIRKLLDFNLEQRLMWIKALLPSAT